jgi:HPt (histidine-containing phosphotransfer) domain-containing protein
MSRKLVGTGSVDVPADLPATEPDLSMLSFLAGDEDSVDAQIERFGETLGETEQAMDRAATSRDFPAMAKAAHLLISQARMVQGGSLAEAALRLETAAKAGEETPVEELRHRVTREIAALMAALRLRRPSVPSA